MKAKCVSVSGSLLMSNYVSLNLLRRKCVVVLLAIGLQVVAN